MRAADGVASPPIHELRPRALAVTAVALAAVLAIGSATASAKPINQRGSIAGVPGSAVTLTAKAVGKEIRKVTRLTFNKIPIACSDNSGGALPKLTLKKIRVTGGRFERRVDLTGMGFVSGTATYEGKFTNRGKRSNGTLSIDAQVSDGITCGTGGTLRWKAS